MSNQHTLISNKIHSFRNFKEQTSLLQKKFHYTINAYKATHTFVYQSSVLVNKIM